MIGEEERVQEIEIAGLIERIDERFDNISVLMTEGALIYGSSLTSMLAEIPASGDLDIAVSRDEFGELAQNLASSSVWRQIDGPPIPERDPSIGIRPYVGFKKTKSGYGKELHLPVSTTVTFEDVRKAKVQIIQASSHHRGLEAAIEVVQSVDMIFCGVAMDKYGKVLEIVPESIADCRDRIMRINKLNDRMDLKSLAARISKYEERGWSSKIDMEKAAELVSKTRKQTVKRASMREPAIDIEIAPSPRSTEHNILLMRRDVLAKICDTIHPRKFSKIDFLKYSLTTCGIDSTRAVVKTKYQYVVFSVKPADFVPPMAREVRGQMLKALNEILTRSVSPPKEMSERQQWNPFQQAGHEPLPLASNARAQYKRRHLEEDEDDTLEQLLSETNEKEETGGNEND